MKEGWLKDEYLILFDGSEADAAADRYGIASELPGFSLVGLRGWDDFLVRDENGRVFTVPTVPLDAGLLAPFQLPPCRSSWGRAEFDVVDSKVSTDDVANIMGLGAVSADYRRLVLFHWSLVVFRVVFWPKGGKSKAQRV